MLAETAAGARSLQPVHHPGRILAAATALVALAASGCHSAAPSVGSSSRGLDQTGQTYFPPGERVQAPALSGRTLGARLLSLGTMLGDGVVVVNVWASWCVECRAESEGLAVLADRLSGDGVQFVGIDEQDHAARARHFAASVGARYPSILDPHGRLLAKLVLLPSSGIPSTLIIDKHGRMAARIVGTARREELARLIQRVAGSG